MQENNKTFYFFLPNGLKIVHRWVDSPVAYVGVMVGAGTRDEREEHNGLAHYIEHCVFKGTENYSARQIISHIEGIGGEVNAYTTKEETTFYAATPVEHIRHTLHLIAEMVQRPTFPKQETDKELGVILDEIESYNDSPSELIYDDFESLVFRGSTLALPILGTKKTLRAISHTPRIAKEWMAAHYRMERAVVFVQGRINPSAVEHMVRKEFDSSAHDCQPPAVEQTRTRVGYSTPDSISYKKHTHQAHVMLGGRAYELGHEKQLTMFLLNNILGGGSLNSRLNMSLREKRGLVYTVESNYTPLSDTGYWSIYYACEPQHRTQCNELVYNELRNLRETTLSSAQLLRAKRQLRGQMAIAAENQENNALGMAKQMLYYDHAPLWEETFLKIEQTTAEQLQETANELLNENNIYTLSYE